MIADIRNGVRYYPDGREVCQNTAAGKAEYHRLKEVACMHHWKARLTPEQVANIRSRSNEPRKKLALEFGTTPRYVSSLICMRKRIFDVQLKDR